MVEWRVILAEDNSEIARIRPEVEPLQYDMLVILKRRFMVTSRIIRLDEGELGYSLKVVETTEIGEAALGVLTPAE